MEMVTAEQAAEAAKGLTFEKVWSAMMITDQEIKETRKAIDETRKAIDESRKETDETRKYLRDIIQDLKESQQKTEKLVAEVTKNLGGLGNTLGIMTEAMFSPDLWKKFRDIGFEFSTQCPHRKFYENNRCLAEADYYLENGEYVMLVEVKTTMEIEFINDHLERIEKIRRYMDAREDKRKIVGAVAGGSVPENVLKYAQRQGLYVITYSGETSAIAESPEGFRAREWVYQSG